MSDKARELLERALEIINASWYGEFELKEEIRAYLAEPEVKRERLSDKEIEEEYWDHIEWTSWTSFLAGVRWAEKMHKVGDSNE